MQLPRFTPREPRLRDSAPRTALSTGQENSKHASGTALSLVDILSPVSTVHTFSGGRSTEEGKTLVKGDIKDKAKPKPKKTRQ